MTKKLQNKLYKAFPKIFVEKNMSPKESCMHWGICCDDGWYDLIYKLCDELQTLSQRFNNQIIAVQVKEKFAALRFYIRTEKDASDELYDKSEAIIEKYSKQSSETCEVTGAHGELYIKGYLYKTLCKESAVLLGFRIVPEKDKNIFI
jgi:hypothetical protein